MESTIATAARDQSGNTEHLSLPGDAVRRPSNCRYIALGKGQFAIVDADDFDILDQHKWRVTTSGYINRSVRIGPGQKAPKKNIWMHRLVAGDPPGLDVDHINGNKLDCRKANLRPATRSQNKMNSAPRRNDGFKGVVRRKNCKTFQAVIKLNGKVISLGYHATPELAFDAYKAAAKTLFGEFARFTKFPCNPLT